MHQHGSLLTAGMFSGGENTVAAQLEKLGFEVARPVDLPDWSVDELMLALDLYLRNRGEISYSATTKAVTDLSAEIRSLQIFPEEIRTSQRFRNPSGVALKLHNFSAIDPDYPGTGMVHFGAADRRTWDDWAHRPGELAQAVALIREIGPTVPGDTGEDEEYEAPEGRVLYRAHRRYERNLKLVAKKKGEVLKKTGRLACEVCDFESSEVYEIHGVIDVHHVVPLHKLGESLTRMSDLALVCPTCHRVLHKHRPIITPAQLRALRP